MNYSDKYELVKASAIDLGSIKNYWDNLSPEAKRGIVGSLAGAVAAPMLMHGGQGVANMLSSSDRKVDLGLGKTLMASALGGLLGNQVMRSPYGEKVEDFTLDQVSNLKDLISRIGR